VGNPTVWQPCHVARMSGAASMTLAEVANARSAAQSNKPTQVGSNCIVHSPMSPHGWLTAKFNRPSACAMGSYVSDWAHGPESGERMMPMFRKAILLAALFAAINIVGIANAEDKLTTQNFSPMPETRVAAGNNLGSLHKILDGIPDTVQANCIEQGQTCVLHGTPCCDPYKCKGRDNCWRPAGRTWL